MYEDGSDESMEGQDEIIEGQDDIIEEQDDKVLEGWGSPINSGAASEW